MHLPDVRAQEFDEALRTFDDKFRASKEFADWESKPQYKFAILANDKRYPVKKMVNPWAHR